MLEMNIAGMVEAFVRCLYALPVLLLGAWLSHKNRGFFLVSILGIAWAVLQVFNFASEQSLLLESVVVKIMSTYVLATILFIVLTLGTAAFAFPEAASKFLGKENT